MSFSCTFGILKNWNFFFLCFVFPPLFVFFLIVFEYNSKFKALKDLIFLASAE